jgi:hypothetical protein
MKTTLKFKKKPYPVISMTYDYDYDYDFSSKTIGRPLYSHQISTKGI